MQTTPPIKVLEQAAFHRRLASTQNPAPMPNFTPAAATSLLVPFNGYYTLSTAPGAFFAIDANVYVSNGGQNKTCLITFYLSLDGKTSSSYPFSSGTFTNNTLQMNDQGVNLDLSFTRLSNQACTASLQGTITIGTNPAVLVNGSTYNNPIESSLFQGTYYLPEKIFLDPGKPASTVMLKVMEIGPNDTLYYDYGAGNEDLKLVDAYVYNMNMYYFKFPQGEGNAQLIMGTAGSLGFACNDMYTEGATATSRNLQTIITANTQESWFPNANSKQLAAFSGYYPLQSIHPLAFVSILGQYTVISGEEVYSATVSYSFDGVNSTSYGFAPTGMTFENQTLTIVDVTNKPVLNLTFAQEYSADTMMLVKMTGSIEQYTNLVGYTPFNPVPLTAFGGVPMRNPESAITIESDTLVNYTKIFLLNPKDKLEYIHTMDQFIYVPLMYILANSWYDPTTVLSLGTSKENGNVSIVIDVATQKTTFVQAIPNPS